ncbi:MAG: class I SAM-dependent methyltransferase [Natronomonas sp.]
MTDHHAYLDAKRAVDDRALSREVLAGVAGVLETDPRVIEIGAGTLTMVERLHDWGLLDGGEWIAVDRDGEALSVGRRRLLERSDTGESSTDGTFRIGDTTVRTIESEAIEYALRAEESADLLVGCAVFDVVDAEAVLSSFADLTEYVYAPITYDGETVFEPTDPDEAAVIDAYHEHMRSYRPGGPDGGSTLRSALSTVVVADRSPWEIEPPYSDDERILVDHIVETVEEAVGETGLDASDWAERRRRQRDDGVLRYRAENVDVFGRP